MAAMSLQYGVASHAASGAGESGDRALVHSYDGGALVAVIDGIGHGDAAAAAARLAEATIARRVHASPAELALRCHEALRRSRGAVLSIARIDVERASLSWLGVGNVSGLVLHAGGRPVRDELLLRAGVVGIGNLPTLRASAIRWRRLDTLIFATDGIRPQFADALVVSGTPQRIAEDILARHCHGNDDALVLVARAN
jgi:phosphoserine phosphatase RsbX